MSDELLKALGRTQREDDAAGQPSGDTSIESLVSPIDNEEASSLLNDVFATVDAADESKPAEPEPEPGNVVELAPRRGRVWVAAAVAIAAAMLLWVFVRPSAPSLPAYTAVSIAGGPADVRSGDESIKTALTLTAADDPIDWRFAPAAPADGVAVAILAKSATGETRFTKVESAEIAASGSVKMHGPLDRFIALEDGVWTVDVLFATLGALPADANKAAAGGDWQSHRIQVTIAAH